MSNLNKFGLDKIYFDMLNAWQLLGIELLIIQLQIAAWTDDYTEISCKTSAGVQPAGTSPTKIQNKIKVEGSQTHLNYTLVKV